MVFVEESAGKSLKNSPKVSSLIPKSAARFCNSQLLFLPHLRQSFG